MDAPPTSNAKIDFSDLTIRAVRPGDFEEVAALASLPRYRWGTLRLPYPSPEDTRKWIEGKSSSPGDVSLVVVYEGKIVGNGGFGRYQGRRSHAAMLGMGIHDDCRGRGVGSHLLREILVLADDWHDLKRVELTVYTDNAPAIALYERNGFTIEGTHKAFAYREGVFVDAYAMARLKP